MHTPARSSQCWSRQTPAWTWSVHLDAPGQRHGQQPVSGTADPGVVKQDKSSRGSVDTTKTRSGPQRVRMSSGERPIGAAKGKQSDTEALCQPPSPPALQTAVAARRRACAVVHVPQHAQDRQPARNSRCGAQQHPRMAQSHSWPAGVPSPWPTRHASLLVETAFVLPSDTRVPKRPQISAKFCEPPDHHPSPCSCPVGEDAPTLLWNTQRERQ